MNEIESPIWIKYAGDLFFLILFLVVFFFVKPHSQAEDEWDQDNNSNSEEAPNPLEQILVTENDQKESLADQEIDVELPSEKESRSDT